MRRQYHRWFAQPLRRDMELVHFGHAGFPIVVFPTSMGAFFEYEDRGMVTAIADKLEAGVVQLICVSTEDTETFYASSMHPRHRIERYLDYERYLTTDVCGFIHEQTGWTTSGVTGCSFGAYHALTMALRHPDRFTSCITMGGAYDVTRFLNGYYDGDAYLLCPPHFLPGLSDSWYLDQIRRNKWVLVTGENDICRKDTEEMSGLLAAKHIPHALHVWQHGSHHDWPEWIKMARAYIP